MARALAGKGEAWMPSVDQLIVWLIIGLFGGSLAGLIVTQQRRGFGFFHNLGLGLIGAVIGGVLFRVFALMPALDKVIISLRDVVAAVAGSLLLVIRLWAWKYFRRAK